MEDKSMTTIALKKINRNKVYMSIYEDRITSKMQIVQKLQMGLSTVGQNLKSLEDEGLIERKGFFESTGGRKAQTIQIARNARISIGLGILKDMVHMAAVDLYGDMVYSESIAMNYAPDEEYYQKAGQAVRLFIEKNKIAPSSILGVAIATQGIISQDGQSVSYGVIMGNAEMKLSDFSRYIPYPCRLEHDSRAAAFLELWNHKNLDSAALFLLNNNLGGAIITEGRVHQGMHMYGGIIEHLCIQPDGPLCYCSNHGCLETYCSANALETAGKMKVPDFFDALRSGQEHCVHVWRDYLEHLAFAVRNLNMLIDGYILISGYLAPYFQEEDIRYLLNQVNSATPFPIKREQILLGNRGQYTSAAGAALHFVDVFLKTV